MFIVTRNKYIKKISANKQSVILFQEIMKDYCKQVNKDKNSLTKEICEAIEKNRLRIHNTRQLMLDGELSATDYKEIKNRYEPEIEKQVSRQLLAREQDSNLLEHVNNAAGLLQNLTEYYTSAALPVKQKLIGSIYPEKLIYEDKAYRTNTINEVITLISRTGETSKENKKRQALNYGSLSEGVIRIGFEPMTLSLEG